MTDPIDLAFATTDLMNITRTQYQNALDAAFDAGMAQGRIEERKHARDQANKAMVGRRHEAVQRYLRSKGWHIAAYKENGIEWTDGGRHHRIGVPNKITPSSWMTVLHSLATYYGKSQDHIAIDILSNSGRN